MGKLLIISFIIPFLIYFWTLLPDVGFWDTGEFQTIPYTLDIAHPTGYPTYILLGKIFLSIFPFGTIAWRMNLLSALLVSIGIFIFSKIIYKVTKNTFLAIAASLFLSVNPYLWPLATRAEPHALHFIFTVLVLFLSLKTIEEKDSHILPVISLLIGLSLGNHMMSLFFIPILVILSFFLIRKYSFKETYKNILLSIVCLLVGFSIYALLPLISSYKESLTVSYQINNIENFRRHVLGEDFQGIMNVWAKGNFTESIKFYLSLLEKSFPFFFWTLCVLGIVIGFIKNKTYNLILVWIFISTLYFGLTYQNAIIERYFVPSFAIVVIWLSMIFSNSFKEKGLFAQKLLSLIFIFLFLYSFKLNLKENNQSQNYHARDWGMSVLSTIKSESTVFSWWSYSTPLWYLQKVEKNRTDVEIINTGSENWEREAIEKIDYNPVYFIENKELKDQNYQLVPFSNIYEFKRF